ncbi:Ig-like domain-containing protein [Heyndrickxia camelliae]|uniref:Gram-positive cocci surface proteins LPxTG domain-containing protein n=1 Tax=Heyndrickxia camelliae TaxID=1707093 RepID=A0A2N3LHV9_9BACI|nr:Ig-like domain-containing protein [Heyndrickxia camelliae]PKR84222.1 hypothetical protein CWO92_15585 [Heyndrickxia camelliae]
MDQPLDSDAKNVTVEYHPDTTSNLVGEEENGSAVEEFVIQAEDTFGHSLQINEPNGTTYNKTPIIKGSIDKDTEHAEITITDSNGSNIIVDKDNITINPDGSWTYNVAEQLSPGEYEVKVTASKSNRDITKYHKFIVADPPVVDPIPPFGQDLQINEPNDITNDTTPSVKGTTDLDTEQAIITITGSNGSKIIVDKDNMNINSDGSWTYNVNQKLSPGEYEVKVTVSKTGYQDVTKSHKFIVVDKETLVNLKDSITSKKLVESEYTQGSWTKFEDAFNKAKLIINNPKATQIEVDNATTSLQNAYDELVYIKALEDEVKQGNNLVQSNYTKDSWDAYQTALTNATKVLDDSSATKEQVNKAKLELENARKSLTPNVDHTQVDKTQLIKEYELSSEFKQEDYTEDSWNNYQKAIAKAKEVINDSKATQEEVDAAKIELENARKSLTPNVDHTQVDKTQLIKEYELSSELKAVDYTKDSWNNYQKAIAKAKEVINDSKATQEEVDAAKIELENARKSLTPNVDHTQVDKTQLIKEYELSSELKAVDYTKDSWNNYQKAIAKAKEVINDSKATQEEVDAAKIELENARKSLTPNVDHTQVDKTQLIKEYELSSELKAVDYTKDSWNNYQKAIAKAKEVINDSKATQEEVDAAKIELENARKSLTPNVDHTQVDKTQLIKEYELSSEFKQEDYTEDSWNNYQKAIAKAKEVINDSKATQEEVDAAKIELENARKSLTPNVDHTQVDKTQLIKEYELSSELKAVDYTKDSWNNYQKAIAKAKEVINDSKATQEEVDAAKIELENARKSLTPNVDHTQVDKTQLIKEYELSSELKAVDYTKDSWNNYQKAIAKAKEIINDSKATQEEVNAAKIELENARKSLTPNVDHTQVDKTQLIKEYELSSELKAADYSKGSWDNYQKALERAKKVINDSKATQEEVDVAKAELEKARRSLSVDKTQLNNEKNYSEDLSAKDYTKDSWKSYQDALNHAKKILADRNATQYEVNAALNRLKESRNALVRLQDSNNQSKNSDKGILPNTATNTYNWLLFGSAFLLLGALFLLRQKRKESK